jgi:CheY-like chemotaxis protein
MDIDMPIMGGIEATKEIRRLERLQGIGISTPPVEDSPVDLPSAAAQPRIPLSTAPLSASSVVIVALTAHNLPADRTKALTAGCNDFISKPVRLNWLNNKIIEWGSIKALQSYAQFAASEQNASASKEQPSHPNSTISLNSPSRPDFGTTLTAPPLSTTELRPAMAVDSHSAPPSTQTSSEPVEISGDEALRIHLADTRRVSSGAQDKDQPLGTRAPSAETNATSIASVMHGGSSTTERNPRVGSQPNSRAIPLQSVPTTGDASFKPPG